MWTRYEDRGLPDAPVKFFADASSEERYASTYATVAGGQLWSVSTNAFWRIRERDDRDRIVAL